MRAPVPFQGYFGLTVIQSNSTDPRLARNACHDVELHRNHSNVVSVGLACKPWKGDLRAAHSETLAKAENMESDSGTQRGTPCYCMVMVMVYGPCRNVVPYPSGGFLSLLASIRERKRAGTCNAGGLFEWTNR